MTRSYMPKLKNLQCSTPESWKFNKPTQLFNVSLNVSQIKGHHVLIYKPLGPLPTILHVHLYRNDFNGFDDWYHYNMIINKGIYSL